jgi:hypothetical protein
MKANEIRTRAGWIPLALLVCVAGAHWAVFLRGGAWSIGAFLSLMSLLPLLALVVWIGTLVRTVLVKQRFVRLLVTHVVTVFCLWPLGWNVMLFPIAFPYAIDTVKPTSSIRVPTDRPMLVAWGGDDIEHNYHAMLPDQRWAYDLTVEPAFTGSKRLEDYGCFGVTVVAPASGRVHVAHDGERDHVPGAVSRELERPLGNHVVIELANGAFLLVAHLREGSVVAREGASIMEGEPIGQCGNSGNTSEPHVHVHTQRQDPRERPVGLAEGLPLYFHGHDGTPMPLGGFDRVGTKGVTRTATGAVIRHAATPTPPS